jgi:hypothetical protein
MFGFTAEGKRGNIENIVQAFHDVLKDPAVRSQERLDIIKTGLRGQIEMDAISPRRLSERAIGRILNTGTIFSDDEMLSAIDKLNLDDVHSYLSVLDPAKACTITFMGNG